MNRVELLDRLNAALADSSFLAGPLLTIADYLMYFMVHPVVVRWCFSDVTGAISNRLFCSQSRRPKAQLSGIPNLCRW